MRKCDNCGNICADNAVICGVCGEALVTDENAVANQPKKKKRFSKKAKAAIIACIAVVVLLAIACGIFVYVRTRIPDENKLKKMLPDEIFEYTIEDDTHIAVIVGEDTDGEIYRSSLVNLKVVDDEKTGDSYKVYCELEVTDALMDRTLFVYLEYRNDIIKGWQLRKFEEYEYPEINLKQGLDDEMLAEYISSVYGFESPVLTDEKIPLDSIVKYAFCYAFGIDEEYEYMDINGTIWIKGYLCADFYDNADFDEPKTYSWYVLEYTEDVESGLKYSLKAEGMWVGDFPNERELRLKIISVTEDEVEWESSTRIYSGDSYEVSTAEGVSNLYFDSYEGKFYFSVATDEGDYVVIFSADSAELEYKGASAKSFVMNNDAELETETVESDTDLPLPSADSEIIYIYGWDEALEDRIELFREKYPMYADLVEFVNLDMPGTSDAYFTAIAELIEENGSNVPSIVLYDSDVVDLFSGSDYISMEDIGITSEMYANAYSYTIEVGSFDDELKALTYEAYPVSFAYRADIAEAVLGTSEPEEVAEYVKDMAQFMDTAQKMKDAGYYMLSGPDDISPVQDTLGSQYDTIYQELVDNGYTAGTYMWSSEWVDNFNGDVFGYFSPPWFTAWTLGFYAEPGTFRVTDAPVSDYWGGTYLGVTRNCTNNELAALVLYTFCCDPDFMAKASAEDFGFPNNRDAVAAMSNAGDSVLDVLGGQDPFPIYDGIAEKIEIK